MALFPYDQKTYETNWASGSWIPLDHPIYLQEVARELTYMEQRVRNTPLTGLILTDSSAVTATDSVLTAIGKLQKQVSLGVLTTDSRLSDARTPSNDSNLVHKTGDETIGGVKTFTNNMKIAGNDVVLGIDSSYDYGIVDIAEKVTNKCIRIGIEQSGGTIGTTTADGLQLKTDNTTRVFIGATGNVGIGTINPQAKLDVNGKIKTVYGTTGGIWNDYGAMLTSDWAYANTGGGDSTRMTPAGSGVSSNFIYSGTERNGSYGKFNVSGGDFEWENQNWTGAWENWTPTINFPGASGITIIHARKKQIGKTMHIVGQINITTPNTSVNSFGFTLPVPARESSSANAYLVDSGVAVSAIGGTAYGHFLVIKPSSNFTGYVVARFSATYEVA